jgi:hypothetical protein
MLQLCRLKKQLKSYTLSWKSKIILCKILIRPVLTYISQIWAVYAFDKKAVAVFERTALRSIFGSKTTMIGELGAIMNCRLCTRK